MPINAGYEFLNAEKEYLDAKTTEEKIFRLEEMIKVAPKHKSAENLLAELRTRLKKLKEKLEKGKKTGKGKKGIRKEGFQFALVGKTNSGKSALLGKITNASPIVSPSPFTTRELQIGTFFYEGLKAQVVDCPSIGSEEFDSGLINNADGLLIVVEKLEDYEEVKGILGKASGKQIVVVNKSDLLSESEIRKLGDKIRSKRINGVIVSASSGLGITELKEKMVLAMNLIRVYFKEPGKPASPKPGVLEIGATVKDAAESIRKGFYLQVKEIRVTGPSSKFPNQVVGMQHTLKDKDIVEFKTR